MARTILVVDDEPKITKLVRAYLEQAGFQVTEAHDGADALEAFRTLNADLIVLDLMLPNIDGIEITRRTRKESDVPIIMLTAKAEEVDRLIGLEIGADDYVVKPFSPRELVARVCTVLRRSPEITSGSNIQPIRIGALTIDEGGRRVFIDGAEVRLTALQFDLLLVMARNPGRVFTRSELLELTTGQSLETYERTVDAHIKNLRKALGERPRGSRFLQTVHGVGYRFGDSHA